MDLTSILDELFFGPTAWVLSALAILFYRPRPEERGLCELFTIIMLAISLIMMVASYLLAPKPKAAQPDSTKDFDVPTSDAGRPIPVVFGTKTVSGPNVLWWGDKRILNDKVSP